MILIAAIHFLYLNYVLVFVLRRKHFHVIFLQVCDAKVSTDAERDEYWHVFYYGAGFPTIARIFLYSKYILIQLLVSPLVINGVHLPN